MIVNATEFQNNFGKYLMLAAREDIIITKNGHEAAKLTTVEQQRGRKLYSDGAVSEETAGYICSNRKAAYSEFLTLTENSPYRYEYIDGEIYLLASPRTAHQMAMKEIFSVFCNWFEGKKCTPIAAPYDLTLRRGKDKTSMYGEPIEATFLRRGYDRPEDKTDVCDESIEAADGGADSANDSEFNIVQPDIMVICDLEEKLNENDYYMGTPALVVEIVSESTRSRDYIKKLDLYMSCGVREYWIVNPLNQSATIYLFKDRNIFDTTGSRERINSYVFSGLTVDLSRVFRNAVKG